MGTDNTDKRLLVRVDNPADLLYWVPVEEERGREGVREPSKSLRELGKRYLLSRLGHQWQRAPGTHFRCIHELVCRLVCLRPAGSDGSDHEGGHSGRSAHLARYPLVHYTVSQFAMVLERQCHHSHSRALQMRG